MMGREVGPDLPEFRIVVRRPSGNGPIAPFKFAVSVLVALVVAFGELRTALATGVADDGVLVRAIAAALFAWVVLSVLNRVLAHGSHDPTPSPARSGTRVESPS